MLIHEDIGAEVTLVLHHPHFFSATYWSGWSTLTGCNIVAFDAPHHGANTTTQPYPEFATSTVDEAVRLAGGPVVVAGVSQGGVIAQESATHPDVAGIVGIATTRCAADGDERERMMSLLDVWQPEGPPPPVANAIAEAATNGAAGPRDATYPAVASMSRDHIAHTIPLLLERRHHLPLPVPALFIHGTADQTYPIAHLADNGADHVIPIDGGSHSLPLEYPQLVGSLLGTFARTVSRGVRR